MAPQSEPTSSSDPDLFWANLLESQERWLRHILSKRLENPEEVEDVFQEIGLAVSRSEHRPTDPDKAVGWLYQVAIRQVLQYRRKAGRYRKLMNRTQEQLPSQDLRADDPLVVLMRTERAAAVRQAVAQLDPKFREVLLLKYVDRLNYREIAQRLDLSRNAVEHRLVKARKALRQQLATDDELPFEISG